MSRNKKRKKNPQQQQIGGYKKFILDLQQALCTFELDVKLQDIPSEYKRMMYDYRIHISNPTAGNTLISPKELKHIADKTKKYYRESNINDSQGTYSTYHLMLLYCYLSIRAKMLAKETGDKNHPEVLKMKKTSSNMFRAHYTYFILHYFRMITQLSNPCCKYYGVNLRTAAIHKDNPMLEIVIEALGIPAPKKMMLIDGVRRPTFRLGMATAKDPVVWITVNKNMLNDYYQGEKEELDVYIQSHAMERMAQRLDLLDKGAINYLLWKNTHTIKKFEFYKGYMLLPVRLYDVKVGYLMARVVEDKVLFRTFLFITHNCTPEGDRLKAISGLGKHDISYWHIDRLSTFVKLNGDKYKDLINLFEQAGITDFQQLKEKDFDIDQMQSVNLDGLMAYIKKGQAAEEEWSRFVGRG